MARPTTGHTAKFTPGNVESAPDGRLFSNVFDRNAPPIVEALTPWIGDCTGNVLEIGCGTGQHAAAMQLAFSKLTWIASDPFELHRASTNAWREFHGLSERPALNLDAAGDWASHVHNLTPLDAIISVNVIHIAPWAVTEGIFCGAARTLSNDGLAIFYGPFMRDGEHIGDGNAAFDRGLRAENSQWGLRDIRDLENLGNQSGLRLEKVQTMPANNRMIFLRKTNPE